MRMEYCLPPKDYVDYLLLNNSLGDLQLLPSSSATCSLKINDFPKFFDNPGHNKSYRVAQILYDDLCLHLLVFPESPADDGFVSVYLMNYNNNKNRVICVECDFKIGDKIQSGEFLLYGYIGCNMMLGFPRLYQHGEEDVEELEISLTIKRVWKNMEEWKLFNTLRSSAMESKEDIQAMKMINKKMTALSETSVKKAEENIQQIKMINEKILADNEALLKKLELEEITEEMDTLMIQSGSTNDDPKETSDASVPDDDQGDDDEMKVEDEESTTATT